MQRLEGLAVEWYVALHESNVPKFCSVLQFMHALWAQFDDSALVENACADLRQLCQGYLAKFHTPIVKLRDWPESMKVDNYWNGLNTVIMTRVLELANPDTLVGWI